MAAPQFVWDPVKAEINKRGTESISEKLLPCSSIHYCF